MQPTLASRHWSGLGHSARGPGTAVAAKALVVAVALTAFVLSSLAGAQTMPGYVIYPVPDYYPEYDGDPRACVVRGRLAPANSTPCAVVCEGGGEPYFGPDTDNREQYEPLQNLCKGMVPGSISQAPAYSPSGPCYIVKGTGPGSAYQPVSFEGHPRCADFDEPPLPPPVPVARVSGDPHLGSLDGVRFDLQDTGEFLGIASLDDDLAVQLRLEADHDRAAVSYTTAVAARVGAHRLMLAARAGAPLRVDGEPVDLQDRHVLQFSDDEASGIVRDDRRYTVIWADGSNLHVDLFSRYLNASFLPAEKRDGRLTGLFGDGNGVPADDFRTRQGRRLSSPPDHESLYEVFAESWRVGPEESLFDYGAGESSASFHRPGVPAGRAWLEDLEPAERRRAEALCRRAGVFEAEPLEECVIDVGFSGDEAFIASALSRQTPMEKWGDVFETWSRRRVSFPLGGASFADRVVSWNPGEPPPPADASVVERTLGPPDYTIDRKTSYLSLGQGGELVVEFTDNVLIDVPGPDLMIFEVSEPEPSMVAISEDGDTWIEVGEADSREALDIAPVATPGARYRYVRLTDRKARNPATVGRAGGSPGPDIDAIGAIGSERPSR